MMECRTMGSFMRYARESRGYTLAEVSRRTGITEASLRRWEHDRCSPILALVIEVCRVLGCTVDEYIGFGK